MPEVVLDTDFLSSFLKIEQLDLVPKFFRTDYILVPTAVYREVATTSLLSGLVALTWVRIERINEPSQLSKIPEFLELGAGEQEAIALTWRLKGATLLMNDRRATHFAQGQGIDVVNLPAFLLACRRSGVLTKSAVRRVIDDLQQKDHFGFSKPALTQLLAD